MAEEKEEVTEENAGGGKKKLIIMIVGALLLVGGAVGGTLMFVGGGEEQTSVEGGAEPEEQLKEYAYLAFEKPLVVNFQAEDGKTRFLKADVSLMLEKDKEDEIKKHLPKIEHVVNMVFSRQKFETLLLPEGKEKMRAEALEEINNALKDEVGEVGIDDVLYTNFVAQ